MWQQLQNAHTQERVRATAGRAADFFGPGVTTSAFGERFFGPLINGKKAEVMGPLPNRHSVTYVRDFARALIELGSDSRAWGRAWHVPNNPALRIGDLVKLAAQAAGTEPASSVITAMKLRIAGKFVPAAKETIEMLYQFQSDFVVDHTPFAQNFTTAATPLPEAIAATVEWYREPARQSG